MAWSESVESVVTVLILRIIIENIINDISVVIIKYADSLVLYKNTNQRIRVRNWYN